jgi:hypothetical protein
MNERGSRGGEGRTDMFAFVEKVEKEGTKTLHFIYIPLSRNTRDSLAFPPLFSKPRVLCEPSSGIHLHYSTFRFHFSFVHHPLCCCCKAVSQEQRFLGLARS